MRSKRALLIIASNILNEIVNIISAFILPRLMLNSFGSHYTGIVSSVSQFVSYVSLLRAGIVATTSASLYKSLAANDTKAISEIILATEIFMRKVAIIYSVLLLLLAVLYPFTVIEDFDWIFSSTLVLIIGAGIVVQYYFGITHRVLIEADQKKHLLLGINILATIVNTIVSVIAISLGAGIHLVKLINTVVFAINPIFIYYYSKRHYKLHRNVEPNYSAINQRWNAFAQQLAGFIDNNTDIVLATIFLSIYEVSVYSIYYLVIQAVQRAIMTIISSLGPFFGNMMARGEKELFRLNIRIFECVTFLICTFVFAVAFVQITPFVSVYTKGVSDVDYYRPVFGYIVCATSYLQCIRMPYVTIITSAGHFRPLRNGAIMESVVNIVLSLALVNKLGIIGLVVGTLVSKASRIFRFSSYSYKNIVDLQFSAFVARLALSLLSMGVIIICTQFISLEYPDDFYMWIVNSCIISSLALTVTLAANCIFYWKELIEVYHKLLIVFRK